MREEGRNGHVREKTAGRTQKDDQNKGEATGIYDRVRKWTLDQGGVLCKWGV